MLCVEPSRRTFPGTLGYALHHLLDDEIDRSDLESRSADHGMNASPNEPWVLVKILRLAYLGDTMPRRGVSSGRCDSLGALRRSGAQWASCASTSAKVAATPAVCTFRPNCRAICVSENRPHTVCIGLAWGTTCSFSRCDGS